MSFLDFVELCRLRFAIEGDDGFFIMRKAPLRLRPLIEFQPGRETAERVSPFNIQIDAETLMIKDSSSDQHFRISIVSQSRFSA